MGRKKRFIEPAPEGQKRCAKCGECFPMTEYFWRRTSQTDDGWSYYCKPCWKAHDQVYYAQERRGKLLDPDYPAFVYFIDNQLGYIKIGWSTNYKQRLHMLQTATPLALSTWLLLACDSRDEAHRVEKHLHILFDSMHALNEWFWFTPEFKHRAVQFLRREIFPELEYECITLPSELQSATDFHKEHENSRSILFSASPTKQMTLFGSTDGE